MKAYVNILILILTLWVVPFGNAQAQDATPYRDMIEDERNQNSKRKAFERGVGASAGLFIGIYGYYFHAKGPMTKLVYSLTQTASTIALGKAIYDYYAPSLVLRMDDYLQRRGKQAPDANSLRLIMSATKQQQDIALNRSIFITSGTLSLLYLYNGYYESKNNVTLRNVYYFLAFDAALISAATALKGFRESPLEVTGFDFNLGVSVAHAQIPKPAPYAHFSFSY